MKRFIGTLVALLLVSNLFGQGSNYFKEKPVYDEECLFNRTYSFVANNKQYVLSYYDAPYKYDVLWSNGEKRERKLYLCRKDSDGWIIASTTSLQTDFQKFVFGKNDDISYNYYFPISGEKNVIDRYFSNYYGYVKQLPNGNVEIRVINIRNDKQDLLRPDENMKPYYTIYVLIPVGNEMYDVTIK